MTEQDMRLRASALNIDPSDYVRAMTAPQPHAEADAFSRGFAAGGGASDQVGPDGKMTEQRRQELQIPDRV